MNFADVIGQTLDEKYQIERELGRGGMGTVYLATHLGTERPVAIKIIAPQFMKRPEFVERFRREARAAGRLRHPNVVNVTDFGFAHTVDGQVAYLVMEYLDGCTLGEILEEEKNLPVAWTLDILEQVCSAVHEAHEQGIIHRDLKPDNIWLEPNQRGGYTVKVLDFGIAKLEAHSTADTGEFPIAAASIPTFVSAGKATLADLSQDGTIHDSISPTRIVDGAAAVHVIEAVSPVGDKETLIQQSNGEESGRLVLRAGTEGLFDQEAVHTKLISDEDDGATFRVDGTSERSLFSDSTGSDLTRVGAVLGTPLYMSPEQCRGDKLDPRSDIYSIGIIAYQMLSGATPFSGDFTQVMESHKECPPPPLNAKKVRKKLKRVIAGALAKDADQRPQTAEAFASILRSRSEGIFGLLRRAGMIYTEHFPKFLGIAVLLFTPFMVATLLNVGFSVFYIGIENQTLGANIWKGAFTLLTMFTGFFCGYLVVGTTTWLVNQILSFPLRPVRIRPALLATRKKWKHLIGTGILSTVLTFLGYALCLIPGIILSVTLALVAPVVMMENLRGFAAMKRSKLLVMRSLRTTTAAVAILFFVPLAVGSATGFVVAVSVKAFSDSGTKVAAASGESVADGDEAKEGGVNVSVGDSRGIQISGGDSGGMTGRIKSVVREALTALIMLPFQILLTSLSSIIVALLYLKTRQAGGESLEDLLSKFEETDKPRKKWQERVRQRLIQSGRITSRS
ncbi:MAG: protein kinase [Pyrinomonadaceae bacterium]